MEDVCTFHKNVDFTNKPIRSGTIIGMEENIIQIKRYQVFLIGRKSHLYGESVSLSKGQVGGIHFIIGSNIHLFLLLK